MQRRERTEGGTQSLLGYANATIGQNQINARSDNRRIPKLQSSLGHLTKRSSPGTGQRVRALQTSSIRGGRVITMAGAEARGGQKLRLHQKEAGDPFSKRPDRGKKGQGILLLAK